MKYEIACPACGAIRTTIQHPRGPRLCGSCARHAVWDVRRLHALSDLVRRSRDHVAILQGMLSQSGPYLTQADVLTALERDVAQLANDVMVAQLTIAAKGVAA